MRTDIDDTQVLRVVLWRRCRAALPQIRFYAPIEGAASNVLVWEEEYASMAEHERRWSERTSDPDWDALVAQRFSEFLIEYHHEIWEAVDLE